MLEQQATQSNLIASGRDQKYYWKHYNHFVKKQNISSSKPPLKIYSKKDNMLKQATTALGESAEILFNRSKFQSNISPPSLLKLTPKNSLSITIDDVILSLSTLNNNAPGITTIPVSFYSAGGYDLATRLSLFYTCLARNAYIPSNMRLDIKVAIPKFKSTAKLSIKQNPDKYRNLGLQNSIYKILDGHLKILLDQWCEKHEIIHQNQGGFQKNSGTLEQIFILQQAFIKSESLYTSFIDLQKA